jgi:elongation factor Ts
MEISAAQVKELRDRTGAGMMDCKKALAESNGDFEKAIDYLRKKGAATAEKRMDRAANEGIILTAVEGSAGYMIEVNCETDFVARSEDFVAFSHAALNAVRAHHPKTLDELLALTSGPMTVAQHLSDIIGKIGEKIQIKRYTTFRTEGTLADYVHPGSKLGVVVELESPKTGEAVAGLAKDLAMQIAAMNPVSVSRDDVPKEIVERELEIYRQQAKEQGKPDAMLDKIAQGKLNKYYQEFTLLEQSYIRDASKTVKEHVEDVGKSLGAPITVVRFERFQIGEAQT